VSIAEAIRARDPSVLPSRRDEAWRWSDLRGLIRQIPPPSPKAEPWPWAAAISGVVDEVLTVVNGRGDTDLAVPDGETQVVGWRFLSATAATAHAAEAWLTVGRGASLTLVETHEGAEAGYLSDLALHIRLLEGASLERIVICEEHPEGVSVVHAEAQLAPRARFRQTVLTTGARRQRIETRLHHPGHGAEVRLDGVYLLEDQRHADLTTLVRHEGVGGATSQLA
jgi:Fe-S cluster assembly protein SufD